MFVNILVINKGCKPAARRITSGDILLCQFAITQPEKLVCVQQEQGDNDGAACPHHLPRILRGHFSCFVIETNENLEKDVICTENEEGTPRKTLCMLLAVCHICGPYLDSGRG
jgi:hypothetical protein